MRDKKNTIEWAKVYLQLEGLFNDHLTIFVLNAI